MDNVESKIVDYNGIRVKVTKLDEKDYVLEPILENSKAKPFKIYCDSDDERFLKKVYLMIKNPGLFVG